ncbi:MAG: glucose 1-dehydrogenase [Aestuariivirgaceae bacterium]
MRLAGKTAIVTGGASGFGKGIARRFAAEGAQVVVADLNEDGAMAVADEIASAGGKAAHVRCDVSVNDDVKGMVDAALKAFGKLNIIINNAGMPQRNQPALDVDEETFDKLFQVNCKSLYLAAVHTVPVFRELGGGVMINTASTAGLRPRPGLTWYNGAKGGAITLTKAMAAEFAADNIRVNALCPVAGDTPMLAEFLGGAVTNEMYAKFVSTVPIGRLSTPLDIANAALFLASDEAAFLTGVCLEVDGGRCI